MFEDCTAKKVFDFFYEISAIPRGSGNETGIASYLVNFAIERSLFYVRDKYNNVFIRKPASLGCRSKEPILLQGHIDMVCVSVPNLKHDFLNQPLDLTVNGDVLSAKGTTLGADDGVAVAIMLALLDSNDEIYPELECLFTSGEEVGMIGMKNFDTGIVTSRRMINLDSSGEGIVTVSCAGGVCTDFTCNLNVDMPKDLIGYKMQLSGFAGGHSGEDINLGRANAIEIAAQILRYIASVSDIYLSYAHGGEKDNAIPTECTVEFFSSDSYHISELFEEALANIRKSISETDTGYKASIESGNFEGKILSGKDSKRLINFLSLLKSGPVSMCREVPDLVETSANTAIILLENGKFKLVVSSRSSNSFDLDDMQIKLNALGELSGLKVLHHDRYPGWPYEKWSHLKELYLSIFKDRFGSEAIASGIHAGLECGIIKEKLPDMDIISIGPEIKNLHSPAETLSISSLNRLYLLVGDMLRELAI